MIEFAIAAFFYVGTVGILASLIYFQGERDSKARQSIDVRMQVEREQWAEERRQLLERIQRPEFTPAARPNDETMEPMELPEPDLSLVGTFVSEASDGE